MRKVDPRSILPAELTVFAHVLDRESTDREREKYREYIVFEWRAWVDGRLLLRSGRLRRNREEVVGPEGSRVHHPKDQVMPAVGHPMTPITKTSMQVHGSQWFPPNYLFHTVCNVDVFFRL